MSTAKMAPDLARPAGIDDLIKSTLSTTDLGKNRALYKKINKLVYDDVMIIPLYVEPRVNAFHPSIQGYATEHTLMAGITYAYPFYMNMWIKK
jgi:ABC-type transport system substrate-binding protein